jgi:DNA polymerase-3 subunit delta
MAASRAEGPWGQPALKKTLAGLAKGWPAGLTVLTGDDLYHLDRAQSAILAHLAPAKDDDFVLSIVGDEPITTAALVGSARSAGMFASRRVVFVRDITSLEGEPEPLVGYAASPPRESYMIVRAPRLDRKRKLHKALAEAGACLAFRSPASDVEFKELEKEMATMAGERGVRLEDRAAQLVLDVCGSDLNRVAMELDKMAVWLGPELAAAAPLDEAAVRGLVAGSGLLSGWELADAVTQRDPVGAMAAARRLLDSGDEPIRIVGGLAFRARALLRAKAMTEAGASRDAATAAARAWYFRDALALGLERYTMKEVLAMPARFLEADRTFKSRSLDKGAVLEALVLRLTAPAPEPL